MESEINIDITKKINLFFDDNGKSLQKILEEFILVSYHNKNL